MGAIPPKRARALRRLALSKANEAATSDVSYIVPGSMHRTAGGNDVVAVRQCHVGLPVRDGIRTVRFNEDGRFESFTGDEVSVGGDPALTPGLSAESAVLVVLGDLLERELIPVDIPFTAAPAEVVARLSDVADTTVLRKAPFTEPILASLLIDATVKRARLVWDLRFRVSGSARGYWALVTATGKSRVVVLESTSSHAVSGAVYLTDPDGGRTEEEFPDRWMDADGTAGNTTVAVDQAGEPRLSTNESGHRVFRPLDPFGIDQGVVNAFHLCNRLNDFFGGLGFSETEGNFQSRHAGDQAGAGDPLRVIVRDQHLEDWAFYDHQPDGTSPAVELSWFRHGRHASLDAHIVIHEFVHGLLDRVAGTKKIPTPFAKQESRALAEGYCDYFAITLRNAWRGPDTPPEWTFARWLTTGQKSVRPEGYDVFNKGYDALAKGRWKTHDAGQVWCAAMLRVHEILGDDLAWQVAFDAIKLLHPGDVGPTFLHARTAVLHAMKKLSATHDELADAATAQAVRDVFSERGMGEGARSPKAKFRDIVASTRPLPEPVIPV